MRLTMRTLLNWINENLSEEDARLIAQKVDESELAKALKNQIEDVMSLPRLAAPSVLDGTPLGNANSSANYLDNSMAPELTPEYEKFCLHNEVILGEVAACHQILSQVLNATLEVSPELRTRLCALYRYVDTGDEFSIPLKNTASEMDGLFDEIPETDPPKAAAAPDAVPSVPAKTPKRSLSDEEPDVPAPNYWKWASLGCGSLLLLGLAVGAILPTSTPGRVIGVLLGRETKVEAPAPAPLAPDQTAQSVNSAEFSENEDANSKMNGEAVPDSPMNETTGAVTETPDAKAEPAAEADDEPDENDEKIAEKSDENAAVETSAEDAPAETSDVRDEADVSEDPEAADFEAADDEEMEPEDADAENSPADQALCQVGASETSGLMTEDGKFLSSNAVLEPQTPILAMDGFYSTVSLGRLLRADLTGACQFSFEEENDALQSVNLEYGRFSFRASAAEDVRKIELKVGNGQIHLAPGTRAAIRVYANRKEKDPQKAEKIVEIYLLAGRLKADFGTGHSFDTSEGPLHIKFEGRSPEEEVLSAVPCWAVADVRLSHERQIAGILRDEALLEPDAKSFLPVLLKFADSKSWEEREMALMALCQFGNEEGIQQTLTAAQGSVRSSTEAAKQILRSAIYSNPKNAEKIKKDAGTFWKVILGGKSK